jgi:hypothetical protein
MVSAEMQRQFKERGIALIPPESGCRWMDDELRYGCKGEAEILVAGHRNEQALAAESQKSTALPIPQDGNHAKYEGSLPPLLQINSRFSSGAGSTFELRRTLDLAHDLYLHDHRLDGRPVLPFAVAIELMAEMAAAASPAFKVAEVREIRLLHGIALEQEKKTARVVARPRTKATPTLNGLVFDVTIGVEDESERLHYQAEVELKTALDAGDEAPFSRPNGSERIHVADGTVPISIADAYRNWLFHGPIFQRIGAIQAMNPEGARAILWPSSPSDCLYGAPHGEWLIDPIVIDCAFQMQVVWARQYWDVTLLPATVQSYRRYAPLSIASVGSAQTNGALHAAQSQTGWSGKELMGEGAVQGIHHEMRIRPESSLPICHADHYFYSPEGRVLGVLTNVQGVGSKGLNRLADKGH